MKSVQILLNSIEKVRGFVDSVSKFDNKFELISGKYVIDGKSIMGILSLDLAEPIRLNIYAKENVDQIMKVISSYTI